MPAAAFVEDAAGRRAISCGRDLSYGKPGFANPYFVATGI